MGWFEDQLNERKEYDETAFGESFLSLAGVAASAEAVNEDTYKFNDTDYKGKAGLKEYLAFMMGALPVKDIIITLVFGLLVSLVGMLIPYFTRTLTGSVIEKQDMNYFILISVFVVSAALGTLLMRAVNGVFQARVSLMLSKNIQRKTMERVLHLPASFFKKYNTGEMSMRTGSMISLASTMVEGVFMTFLSALISMVYLIQLSQFTPTLVIPTVLILICTTVFSILISFVSMKVVKMQLKRSSKAAGLTYEVINGIQKIRLSGAEKRIFVKWAEVYAKAARLTYHPPKIMLISSSFQLFIALIGNIVIYLTAGTGDISVGDYMAFQAGFGILSGAFASIAGIVASLSRIFPDLSMVSPILDEVPETEDPNKITLEKVDGNIKIENVSFSYGENLPNVLDDISIEINSGDYVAIVGKTGCGKSTFVRLLLGFEEPKSGNIYYDGHNMKELNLTSVRRNIGTVTQNGTLFHADILSNILISAPSKTEKDAWEAATIANIADDISSMPMGMHTIISEGQGSISGGQKQRIMIARAIVNKPKILIFDEATSALDNVTQQSISDSINKLNCTRIVIAHRLSTIQNADRIIMLEAGHIIEEGSYDELIREDGKFAELVKRQRLDID